VREKFYFPPLLLAKYLLVTFFQVYHFTNYLKQILLRWRNLLHPPTFRREARFHPPRTPFNPPSFQSKGKEEFLFMRVGVGFPMVSNVFTKMRCTPRHVPLESLLLDLLEHRGNETANLFSSID
jgi:hypothetical protein